MRKEGRRFHWTRRHNHLSIANCFTERSTQKAFKINLKTVHMERTFRTIEGTGRSIVRM